MKALKTLKVPLIQGLDISMAPQLIRQAVQEAGIPFVPIDCVNWVKFPYKPKVLFKLIHIREAFYFHFQVTEKGVRTKHSVDQEPVYEDSCVELFIDPAQDGTYYNFEFNAIGTMLLAHGESRLNRSPASEAILNKVTRKASLDKSSPGSVDEETSWNLELLIPFSAFYRHNITGVIKEFRCNLYKCGDKTEIPHYLSYSPIESEKPDFHRPEFFAQASLSSL